MPVNKKLYVIQQQQQPDLLTRFLFQVSVVAVTPSETWINLAMICFCFFTVVAVAVAAVAAVAAAAAAAVSVAVDVAVVFVFRFTVTVIGTLDRCSYVVL